MRVALMRNTVHLVSARDYLALRPLVQSVFDRDLYANRAHRAGIEGVAIEALVAVGRALLEVRPRTAKELGELLRERWPDPASLARAIRHLVPLVQVPPRGIWGKSGRAAHYGSLQTGLAFLPATLVLGALSYSAAAKVVNRFGVKPMLVVGMALLVTSLLLFARAPVGGSFLVDVLPGMLLLGFGASFAFLTVILASVSGVPERDAGLASGLVNTAKQLGGALGLAVLTSVAASRTEGLAGAGIEPAAALNGGYQAAFLLSAIFVALAAITLRRC